MDARLGSYQRRPAFSWQSDALTTTLPSATRTHYENYLEICMQDTLYAPLH